MNGCSQWAALSMGTMCTPICIFIESSKTIISIHANKFSWLCRQIGHWIPNLFFGHWIAFCARLFSFAINAPFSSSDMMAPVQSNCRHWIQNFICSNCDRWWWSKSIFTRQTIKHLKMHVGVVRLDSGIYIIQNNNNVARIQMKNSFK